MGYLGTYKDVGLTKMDIIVILKSITNKALLFDTLLVARNHQSIFSYSDDLPQFLSSYNPKTYFTDYCSERISDFERRLKQRLMTGAELAVGEEVSFPRKEMTANAGRYRQRDNRPLGIRDFDTRDRPTNIQREHREEERPLREEQRQKPYQSPVENYQQSRDRGARDPRMARKSTNYEKPDHQQDSGKRKSVARNRKDSKTRQIKSRSSSSSNSSSESQKKEQNIKNKRADSQSKSKAKEKRKNATSSSSKDSSSSNKSSIC